MARPLSIDDDQLLDRLLGVFREHGFAGAGIADLSAASGLQRASLYHRFPGGKEEMATAALAEVGRRFGWILEPMRDDPDVARGVAETARRIGAFYGAGALSCVLETMTLVGSPPPVRDQARQMAETWIEVMAAAARRAGRSPADASAAAREVFVGIEGALVLGRVSGDTAAFAASVQRLPELLLP